jgi:CheY-like chemotaxis protein
MGKIRGDVDVLGIANLLQVLSNNGCEGYLTIAQDGQKKVIEFTSRGIRLVSGARRTNPLGEILLRSGKITREQLDDLLVQQRKTGKPLGEIVAETGLLSKAVIDGALREQVSEEIYDLFTWLEATFEFITLGGDDPAPPDQGLLATVVLDQTVMSIMLEAARRVDELSRIQAVIPDVRLIAERLELPATLDDPGLDRDALEEILPLVDGEKSVGEIIEESLYPKFTVLRTLYGLAQRGVVKIRARSDASTSPQTVVLRRVTPLSERGKPGGRTVLLLSDLPTFRSLLGMFLRSAGYDVVEGGGVAQVAEAVARQRVDVVVLDVSIETEDGLATCQKLRETTPETPFIVLAGNTSRQAVSNAVQSGARYVLLKPVKQDLLLERISNVLKPPEPASN